MVFTEQTVRLEVLAEALRDELRRTIANRVSASTQEDRADARYISDQLDKAIYYVDLALDRIDP